MAASEATTRKALRAFDRLWPSGAPFPPVVPWMAATASRAEFRSAIAANPGAFLDARRQASEAGEAHVVESAMGWATVECLIGVAAICLVVAVVAANCKDEVEGEGEDSESEEGTDTDEDDDTSDDEGGCWDPPPEKP